MDYSRKIAERLGNSAAFLDFCHEYDSNPFVCGMGKDNLFARGDL